jgi:nucleotide-binding universal stress UspA family protein
MTHYARIVVPTDFSPASESALRTALDLAVQLGGHVHVLHVWQLPVYSVPETYFLLGEEATALLVEGLEASLAQLVAEHTTREGVTVRTHLVQGSPEHEIHRLVTQIDAQMITMGTHGRHGLSHLVLGSVAEKVIRSARVPVVVVPPAAPK